MKLINHDCLPILMLLLAAYLMLFAALSNAACSYYDFFRFFAIDFCKRFLLSCFVLVY